jgi:hypothetical protein
MVVSKCIVHVFPLHVLYMATTEPDDNVGPVSWQADAHGRLKPINGNPTLPFNTCNS